MKATFIARKCALVGVTLLFAMGAQAQNTKPRANEAQNGGSVAVDSTPKFNPGLNGRVKPKAATSRVSAAQNGGDVAAAAHVQPKHHAGLGGRSPLTIAQSDAPATRAAEK